jgi:amidophosphoribosyltransferase
MLREAGAAEIHVRISSPPITWPCFYGIDFATRAELIASGLAAEDVRASIGADSLGYLSKDGMIAASGQPEKTLCTACFTGEYPIELPTLERGAAACDPGPDEETDRLVREQQETLND